MLGAGAPALYTAATELNLMANNASGVIKFAAGGSSEQMRLTNTGLGIKKSNPVCALDVVGIGQTSGNFLAGFGNTVADIVASSSVANGGAGFSEFLFGNASGNSRGYLSYSHAADALSIGTTGTTKATLDSSGNLGLGVTPSTGGYGVAFQIAQAGDGGAITAQAISANNYPVNLTANAISSGSSTWKYSNTDASSASRYQQVAGAHSWYTAPSGTAGNAITFTQAATLDASGHFMIGTTSTTGSASNDKIVAGGRFRTVSGSVSAATATATTLFTAPTALAAWLVTVNVDADSVLYSATYIVNTQGGSSTVATLIYKGSLISVSVSGYNVQATQTSGGTATIQYSAVRIF